MFNHAYPYTSLNEINLDWIIAQIMKLHHDYDEFKAVNTITNAGAWDITKQYQAWTVVSDNNAGYISLKPVPAGVAISNTEYWGLIADYNILITNLSARISALENTVGDNNSGLVKDVNTLQAQITPLLPLVNKKYVFLGDSYNYNGGGWLSGVVAGLGLDPSQYYDYTVSGHGFVGVSQKWALDLAQFVSDHPDVVADITDIVIVGGINDCTDTAKTQVESELTDFIDYAETNVPGAHITMCFVGNANAESSDLLTRTYKNRMNVSGIEERVLQSRGHSFNNGCLNALYMHTFFEADGIHPNTYGQSLGIIPAVIAALTNGNFDPRNVYENGTFPEYNGIKEIITDGKNKLILGTYNVDIGVEVKAAWRDLLTLPNNCGGHHHEAVAAVLEDRDGVQSERYGVYLRVKDGKIQVHSADTINSGTYRTFTTDSDTYIQYVCFVDDIQNSI